MNFYITNNITNITDITNDSKLIEYKESYMLFILVIFLFLSIVFTLVMCIAKYIESYLRSTQSEGSGQNL